MGLQADRLLERTRTALTPHPATRHYDHGTTACLSALFYCGRFAELAALLKHETFWPYKRWEVKALVASGNRAAALRCAEACRDPYGGTVAIDIACEEILLAAGLRDEAYQRYAMRANQRGTHQGTFRAVAQKYPHKSAAEILASLVQTTPGEEGKWLPPRNMPGSTPKPLP